MEVQQEKLSPDRQVAGNHYNVMKIQPAKFWRANDYDADAGMILKYLARHTRKNGREDVEKALSFVQIRIDNGQFNMVPRWHNISMGQFITDNEIDDDTGRALYNLHAWVLSGGTTGPFSAHLVDAIQYILLSQYPT